MDKKDTLYKKRHSLAHILAIVALEHDPEAKITLGPPVDDGFYYDIEFSEDKTPTPAELKNMEKKMRKLVSRGLEFEKKEILKDEALSLFKGNQYKEEMISKIAESGEKITTYTSGEFTDLCEGPHVDNTKEIDPKSFKIDRIAGAYWRGDEKNTMLTRIYGLAFDTPEKLKEYVERRTEALKRDHKKLGKELDLFFIDEQVGKGLPMWTPKGTAIKIELENFTRDLERQYGYDHVSTPYLGSEKLYATSGHLDHYKENMYAPIDMDGDIFYLRPMACPHHIRMLLRKPISYRDLPVRYAEIADYNRYEKSGELMGMIRLRKFQLTDAHVFVSSDQLKEEFKNVCRLIQDGMKGLGLSDEVSYRFSKRDPNNTHKYFDNNELWNKAEKMMKDALDELNFEYVEAEDEAAFYGPKLDVQAKNVNGKEDTLFTAQIDFLLPEKFDINFTNEKGEEERIVMIHRSAIGSLERTFAFLIEHYGGNFPTWLSPTQITILPIGEKHRDYAQDVYEKLKKAGIRAEIDNDDETLGKKIREVKMQKTPYFAVIGDKEVESKTVTLESRDKDTIGEKSLDELTTYLKEEITSRD